MKHAKKMQLVEYRAPKPSLQPTNMCNYAPRDEDYTKPYILQKLDNEMSTILSDVTTDISQKWRLYNQALQRYLGFVKRMNQNLVIRDNNATGDTPDDAVDNTTVTPDGNYDDDAYHQASITLQNDDLNNDHQMADMEEALAAVARKKKIVTRRNAEPWDLVTPLHTPKKKKNIERRYPYKARYRTGAADKRSEASNRRSIGIDTLRGLNGAEALSRSNVFAVDDYHPLSNTDIQTQNKPAARVSPNHGSKSNHGGIIKNCSVRLNSVLSDWVTTGIKK